MFLLKVLELLIGLPFVLTKLCLFTFYGILKNVAPISLLRKKSIEGEIALITGAGSGIGRQISLNLAQRGAHLVLWDVDDAGNKKTAQMVKKLGKVDVWTYTCDVANRQAIYAVAERVKNEVGTVTILVNNAGIVSGNYFLDLPEEKIKKTMEVNTMAHFWVSPSFFNGFIS